MTFKYRHNNPRASVPGSAGVYVRQIPFCLIAQSRNSRQVESQQGKAGHFCALVPSGIAFIGRIGLLAADANLALAARVVRRLLALKAKISFIIIRPNFGPDDSSSSMPCAYSS